MWATRNSVPRLKKLISIIKYVLLFGRPKHRWEGNIKMSVEEEVGEECSGLIWLRTRNGGGPFLNAVMNLRVP